MTTPAATIPTVETITVGELADRLCRAFEAVERTSYESFEISQVIAPFMRTMIAMMVTHTTAADFYDAIHPELAKITDRVFSDREIMMTKWACDIDTAIYSYPVLTQEIIDALFA